VTRALLWDGAHERRIVVAETDPTLSFPGLVGPAASPSRAAAAGIVQRHAAAAAVTAARTSRRRRARTSDE